MHFLEPTSFLFWAPLALVPVVLYLFRPRPRTVPTTTLPFFQRLARQYQDSTWLRWLKHLLSLLLSILVVLIAAAVLGRLVVAPPAQSLKTLVVLVDRSASMSAATPGGPNRLDEALALARQRLAGLPAGVGVVVMAYDRRPEVLLSRCTDRRPVERALAAIHLRPIEGDAEAAMRLAFSLASLETPAAVWHLTDAPKPVEGQTTDVSASSGTGKEPAAGELRVPLAAPLAAPPGVTVEHLSVGLSGAGNVGITAFELRRAPLEPSRLEAFVQVHSAAAEPVQAELEMRLDSALVAIRKLTIPPRGRERLLIPVDASREADRVLALKVTTPGDVLACDDEVAARVPRLRPVRVLWISPAPDPFTELALSSLGEGSLEVLHGPPTAWPPRELPDVAIFDGWLPREWPQGVAVVVINPPGSLGPVRAVPLARGGLPLDTLCPADRAHPLLYGVATGRVALTQTAVVEATGPLESVWTGPQGPVLLAGDWRGQRVVVLAFSPQRSEHLPLMASYPLLVGNVIYWAAQSPMEASCGANRRTGEVMPLKGRTITWRRPGDLAEESGGEIVGNWTELDRVGLWETDQGEAGSAAVLSSSETLLPAAADEETPEAATAAAWFGGGDLAPLLLWGLLAILVGESFLYHRYWAY